VPQGTKSFEGAALLDDKERFRALSVKGVTDAVPVLTGFGQWRTSGGSAASIFLVGSDPQRPGLHPWNIVAGNLGALSVPDAVAIDESYFDRMGSKGLGDVGEIRGRRAQVQVVTSGIRSFTTTPFVFTSLAHARAYTGTPANKASYLLLHLALGMIVGTVIVAQTLYSSTKDHLNEFATLRAIGSSGMYIYAVIIIQALLSAVIGFGMAAGVGFVVVKLTAQSALPVLMTPTLMSGLFVLTVAMCIVSAVSAIVQIMRMDPAMVFTR